MVELVLLSVFIVGIKDCVKITLKISIGELISWLEFSIVLVMFLYCVVGKVYKLVVQVFHVELLRSSSYVSILKPISFLVSVYACQTYIAPDIELSFLIKERHNVLLDDMCAWTTQSVNFFSLNDFLYLFKAFNHLYAITSVCIFSWFYQPSITFFGLESIFQLLSFLFFFLLLYRLVSSLVLLLES